MIFAIRTATLTDRFGIVGDTAVDLLKVERADDERGDTENSEKFQNHLELVKRE